MDDMATPIEVKAKTKEKPSRISEKKIPVGINSRAKGHKWERKVAMLFRNAGFEHARRVIQGQLDQNAPDVLAGDLMIECKRVKKMTAAIFERAVTQIRNAGKNPDYVDYPRLAIAWKEDRTRAQLVLVDVKPVGHGQTSIRFQDFDLLNYLATHAKLKEES